MTDKRRENESFEHYKKKQKLEKLEFKHFKRGTVVWDSSRYGTYKREKAIGGVS